MVNIEAYKHLIEFSPFGFANHKIIVDETEKPVDYVFLETNKAFEELTGLKHAEIIGKKFSETFPNANNKEFDLIAFYGGIALNGGQQDFEQYSKSLKRWYKVQVYSPERYYFTTVFVDVTENKEAENLLNQTRINYETFFNNIDDFLFVLDEQGNIIHTNSTVINRLEYTDDELLGKSVLMVHPQERREEAGRIVGEMLKGTTEFCPVPVESKSGKQIPVETRVTRGVWNGKPAIFGVTKDMSKIKLSEEKFSKVFYINPSACGLSDLATGEYIEVNEAFYSLLGFNKDEVIGNTASDLGILTPETKKDLLQNIGNDEKITNIEADLRSKNGDIKHVLLSAENIYVQDKKLRFTAVHDITMQKRAEKELRENRWRLESIIESAHVGTWEWNVQTGDTVFNDVWAQIIGYDKIEQLGPVSVKTWEALVHPEDLEQSAMMLERHFNGELPYYSLECRMKHKNGNWVWVLDHGCVVTHTEDGKPLMMFGTHTDINERKETENALKESEERYRLLIETSQEGIVVAQGNKLVYFNPTMLEITGYNSYELFSMNFIELFFNDDKDLILTNYKKRLAGEKLEQKYHVRMVSKDQSLKWIEMSGVRLEWKGQNATLNFLNDITEKKLAEIELFKINEELQIAKLIVEENLFQRNLIIEELSRIKEKLEKSNSEKDKFFSIIAHDLKNPFMGLVGLSQMLAEDINAFTMEEISEMSKDLHISAVNLLKLLENLLEWARMQKGNISFNPKEIDLFAMSAYNVGIIGQRAMQKGIKIINEVRESQVVYADEKMIDTILRNILSNAVKFTKHGGKILINAKEIENQFVEISIADSGIGMSEILRQKLFKIEEKVGRKGTEGESSTGLGLLLCKEFVEKQGGKIWVNSEENIGSTFYFTIPAITH